MLFDLDGTLVDTIPLIVASYQHAFRSVLGEEVSQERAKAWIGRPLLPALLEESPEHGHELDRAYREWNLANTARLIRPYAGIDDLLAALAAAGVRTAVVTSKRRDTARLALASVGLDEAIDVVGALEDTTEHKPLPGPLLFGAASLGAAPAECVYVGDATVDMAAALAAGMGAVAVTWGRATARRSRRPVRRPCVTRSGSSRHSCSPDLTPISHVGCALPRCDPGARTQLVKSGEAWGVCGS